jgi:BirA family transcriptional regulator, biotin operon repressor / biotin---[acetyl-CoA-carboxylase] ligase
LPGYVRMELTTQVLGRGEILYAAEMGSTNAELKRAAAACALPAGSLAVCGRQTGGKGRLNRVWVDTGADEMLPCSLLLRPSLPPEKTPLLTLAVAVAAADAIGDFGLKAGIKWPNDVVLNGRKCVGILCETVADPAGARCVVAGAGFNVNQRVFPAELAEKATSLRMEGGWAVGRRALLCRYLEHVERVTALLENEGFGRFLPLYAARSVTLGSRVRVEGANETFTGTAESIDDAGALRVRTDVGELKRVLSGDVSVRGVMGYV